MAAMTVEERLDALEAEVAELKAQLTREKSLNGLPWWEQRFGAFADSPEYEELTRLGREYRESLRPKDQPDAIKLSVLFENFGVFTTIVALKICRRSAPQLPMS